VTQLHYHVSIGGPNLRAAYAELLTLHADEASLMLTAFEDETPPDYRAWIRLPHGRIFGKHALTKELAVRNLIAKLRRVA
jgi:hypothetical protein